jgi:hypothetical protein
MMKERNVRRRGIERHAKTQLASPGTAWAFNSQNLPEKQREIERGALDQ